MKSLNLKNLFFMFATFMLVACGGSDPVTDDDGNGDDPSITLTADFEYAIEQGTGKVSFTNKSANATEYEWEFGDENEGYSSDKNPVYTYSKGGSYTVTLTTLDAKGNYKEKAQKIDIVLKKPEIGITIDGNTTDWADIPWREDINLAGGLKKIKTAATDNSLYIYMVSTKEMFNKQRYITAALDLDNNAATGANEARSKTGADVMRQVDGFFLWGWRAEEKTIGWDWIEDNSFIEWNSKVIGNEAHLEWKLNLTYARTHMLTNNDVFQIPDIDYSKFAKLASTDLIKMYIWFRDDPNWDYIGEAPADGDAPFSIKLNEYVEKKQ